MTARASDKFHSLVINFNQASAAFFADQTSDPEILAAQMRSIEEITNTELVATTYQSAIDAIKAASKDMTDFDQSEVAATLVKGALAFFEKLEAASGTAPIHAMNMAAGLSLVGIRKGIEWLAVYDALTITEEVAAAFVNRPACSNGEFLMSAAGEYIETISEFLVWEKTRVLDAMRVAAAETRDDPELLNKAILAHDVKYSEFGFADIQPQVAAMSAQYDAYKARRIRR